MLTIPNANGSDLTPKANDPRQSASVANARENDANKKPESFGRLVKGPAKGQSAGKLNETKEVAEQQDPQITTALAELVIAPDASLGSAYAASVTTMQTDSLKQQASDILSHFVQMSRVPESQLRTSRADNPSIGSLVQTATEPGKAVDASLLSTTRPTDPLSSRSVGSDLANLITAMNQQGTTQGTGQSAPLTTASQTAAQASATAEWAPVRVDTQAGKWGEQMLQVLNDRVTLQAQQNLQEARIRLDPPDLGKLDLMVRVEGDRLSVHINANAAATREALMQVSERLRAELQNQNFMHVDVQVGSGDSQHSSPNHTQDDESTIFASRSIGDDANFNASSFTSEHWLHTQA